MESIIELNDNYNAYLNMIFQLSSRINKYALCRIFLTMRQR